MFCVFPTEEKRTHDANLVPFHQSSGGLQNGPWEIGVFMSFRARKRAIRYLIVYRYCLLDFDNA